MLGPHHAGQVGLVGEAKLRGEIGEAARTSGHERLERFTEITANSCRWLGYVRDGDGSEWQLEQELRATRRAGSAVPT